MTPRFIIISHAKYLRLSRITVTENKINEVPSSTFQLVVVHNDTVKSHKKDDGVCEFVHTGFCKPWQLSGVNVNSPKTSSAIQV